MTTYAIGDIQGCFAPLQALLEKIQFNIKRDTLWFTGDLVNRGPQSLEVLRFIKSLGSKHITVLGNHDLHLLARAYGLSEAQEGDTLAPILAAPDVKELMDWLRHCPLLHHDAALGYTLVHAGLAPVWSLQQASSLAQEVESVLRGATPAAFLEKMYGNQPDHWDDHLTGMDRLRCITNYFTRMRFCDAKGRLDFSNKGNVFATSSLLFPWFEVPNRCNANEKIIFGHWAALQGHITKAIPNVYALDTGCVWGHCLTALCLEDGKRYSVACV